LLRTGQKQLKHNHNKITTKTHLKGCGKTPKKAKLAENPQKSENKGHTYEEICLRTGQKQLKHNHNKIITKTHLKGCGKTPKKRKSKLQKLRKRLKGWS